MIHRKEIEIGGRTLSIETGKIAKQASGSAWVQYGETIVHAAVVGEKKTVEGQDFFPLSVDYREKTSAAGKIPGGFFKREGRPSEKEILTARLIDRPIRPLFPDWYNCETQILVTVLSADGENDGGCLGAIASSAALAVSDLPILKTMAEVTVARIDGEFVINPTFEQLESSEMEIVVGGTADSILMVEGELKEIQEGVLIGAINFAHENIKKIVKMIGELAVETGTPKRIQPEPEDLSELTAKVIELDNGRIASACNIIEKTERNDRLAEIKTEIQESLAELFPDMENKIADILLDIEKKVMRKNILEESRRLDGRGFTDIREITSEIALLPRAHGSALFTRGQTQALVTSTLGSRVDEQRIDSLEGDYFKRFILHYNFPGFSTGEITKRMGVGRREVGHGNLAERALKVVLPSYDEFPYTIRIVSDIMESNGSSSMATICGGSLSLMDAGVPISSPVAGIAMGLVMEAGKAVILTDILGDEDHLGDMDFKVAGTRSGITSVQMDIKIDGISTELMQKALDQAKDARLRILDSMAQTIAEPRRELSPYAPSILFIQIEVEKIGSVIGPGGRIIRDIIEKTGASINVEDDGSIQIASNNQAGAVEAQRMIMAMTEDPEIGKIYEGPIKKITDFGAFVEILPGKEGLLHVSNIAYNRVNHPSDVLKVGEIVRVKLLDLDSQGKMDLSRKALLEKPDGYVEPEKRSSRPSDSRRSGGSNRGGRGSSGGGGYNRR